MTEPSQIKLYGRPFKKVTGTNFYTLFGKDRWQFIDGHPVEMYKDEKLLEARKKNWTELDFTPQFVSFLGRKQAK